MMISRIKAFFTYRLGQVIDAMPSKRYEMLQWQLDDIQAMTHLNSLTPQGIYIPFTSWSMRPAAIVHLLNEILIKGKRNIVEFGPGASSIYMAKLIVAHNLPARLMCIESDSGWINVLRNTLIGQNLDHVVDFIEVPIAESPYMPNTSWYDVNILSQSTFSEVDMVIVDGPPAASSAFSRYGAVPFMVPYLTEDATIFLDDAHRPDEQAILQKWKHLLSQDFVYYRKYAITKYQGFNPRPISATYQTVLDYL